MSDLQRFEIPGHVSLAKGEGGLMKILVETDASHAEIYLHGAHVTRFQKKGEEPLLFMSAASDFAADKPIRGGVPLIFPWFGPREGLPAHGFARTVEWDLKETSLLPDGSVSLRFGLPKVAYYDVEFRVVVSDRLTLELTVKNNSERDAVFETCLHTYFQISDIDAIAITGLTGARYIDKLANLEKTDTSDAIRIASEVERVYPDSTATVEIEDPGFGRRIRIEKSGSDATVVWNPWIDKSIRMPDFGDEEYVKMVCVESGNIAQNQTTLLPGERAVMKVEVSSGKLLS